MLEQYLGQGREKAIERVRALDDLSAMLDDPKFEDIRPETQEVLRKMVDSYKSYVKQKEVFDLIGGNREIIDLVRTSTLSNIKELANFNENTLSAYMSIFSRLLGE
jgi:nitrogenase molybdenum-iron protein alpha/beta subunit